MGGSSNIKTSTLNYRMGLIRFYSGENVGENPTPPVNNKNKPMISYYGDDKEDEQDVEEVDLNKATVLEDTSLMPFGKFKGKPMESVDASWLHWFYTTARANNPNAVAVIEYIRCNRSALKEEYPDGIWIREPHLDQ